MMYFWDGEQIIFEPREILTSNCEPYVDMPCCDDRSHDYSFGRYGMFRDTLNNGWDCWWEGGTVDTLPKEFLVQLLLLGVS